MMKVSAYVKKIPREKENDTAVNIFFCYGLVYLQDNFNDGLFQGQVSPQDFSLGLLKLLKTTGKLTFSQSFFSGPLFPPQVHTEVNGVPSIKGSFMATGYRHAEGFDTKASEELLPLNKPHLAYKNQTSRFRKIPGFF